MSGNRSWRRALAAADGTAAVSFAVVLPMLLALSFGILDLSLLVFDYHRAGEATRRGARAAAIADPMADLSALPTGGTVTCTGQTVVSCSGGSMTNPAIFSQILAEMQAIHAGIGAENVSIEYSSSGLGDPDSPGGILPLITVRLVGLQHSFAMLQALPGFPTLVRFPDFATAHIGSAVHP